MYLRNTDVVEAAGRIINQSGINALSIEEMSREMGIAQDILLFYYKNNDDILILLLRSLENEIKQFVSDVNTRDLSSEEELHTLFETLIDLFGQKPYYLSIIFSTELADKDVAIQEILLRIKSIAKIHLVKIINHGKKDKMFQTKQTTKSLANNILGSFRLLMNEQRVIDKMVRDIEILKNTGDTIKKN
jgi:AcrR family transcriptional regulator